jgi:bla regulator protein BlaR1
MIVHYSNLFMHSIFMQIVGESVVRALSWTLFHSLWQGLLLALLAGFVVMATKKSSPSVRYNILCVLFFAFLAGSFYTFMSLLDFSAQRSGGQPFFAGQTSAQSDASGTLLNHVSMETSFRVWLGKCLWYFNGHAYLFVTIWFVIFCARFVKFLANISYMQRARNYQTETAASHWQERMRSLASLMGIKINIALLQSQWVKVPMVAGFLKPVILFPFSMLSQLPPDQVEAVLLHELAHIRRRDYFVNILQSLADVIFFFNPGVLWISSLIRDERENCCDDMAVSHSKSSKAFIHALLAFQEYNLGSGHYAPAFPGRKNHLLQRVKRMLNHHNQTLNNMERVFLGACLLAITLGSVAFSQNARHHKVIKATVQDTLAPVKPNISIATVPPAPVPEAPLPGVAAVEKIDVSVPEATNDTTPSRKKGGKFIIDEDGVVIYIRDGWRIETKDDKIIRAFQNENPLSAEKIAEMEPLLRKVIEEQKIESFKAFEADKDVLINKHHEMELLQGVQMEKMAELQKNLLDKEQSMMKDKSLLELQQNQQNYLELQEKMEMENQIQLKKSILDRNRLLADQAHLSELRNLTDPILDDLLEDHLIKNKDEASFELDKDKLIINKMRQSNAIHKKYKEKFIKRAKDHYIYSASKGSTHTDVNVDQ